MALSDIAFRPQRIETPRVVLRGYEPTDAESIFAYASDPDTTRYMAWERHTAVADAHTFLNAFVAPQYERDGLEYAITLRGAEDRCIGGLGLRWHPREHDVMELGYVLHRDLWGQGLVPEACAALIAHAFAATSVERIYAPILSPNTKSRRVAEKLGMYLDGVLRSNRRLRGRRWDEAIYSLVRQDALEIERYGG